MLEILTWMIPRVQLEGCVPCWKQVYKEIEYATKQICSAVSSDDE